MRKRILVFSSVLFLTVAYLLGPSYDAFATLGGGSGKKQLKIKCAAPYEKYYSTTCTGTKSVCHYTQSCPAVSK